MMEIGRPAWLWLLWLVPLLAAFEVYALRRRRALLHRFAQADVAARLTLGLSDGRRVFKVALIVVAAALLLVALVGLRVGFTWEEIERRGVDIVIALDVSDSMLVADAAAGENLTRLERARRKIADLVGMLRGDRIALVAFAGTAFVQCPLTLDYGAAALFLEELSTDLIPVKGTNIAGAIETSLQVFEGGSGKSRAILLITDGEDHSGAALSAAEKARAAGVHVFTIGIGRDEGSPIPDGAGGFRRDASGELILSRVDEASLQKIALSTGGKYVRSVTGDLDLEAVYEQGIKATLVDEALASKRQRRYEDRFQILVALSLLLLGAEPLVSEWRRAT